MSEVPDYIPLAMMNAYAYCPRRFYYEFTLGEMVVNEYVLAGQQLHERVDQPGQTKREGKLQLRRVYLCAPKLGLNGYCDLLEAETEGLGTGDLVTLAQAGQLYPVEYKKGKLGQWLSDHIQLCCQALALEEGLAVPAGTIRHGYVFYFGSARREEVAIDEALRLRTQDLVKEARQVARQSYPPVPITNRRKCKDCSLEPICLPREILAFEANKRKKGATNDGDFVSD
ncbi:MAG: CRISPR-associated protein Cas4 [Chloroflexota bacterium]|nr:CRISPR-associated protein Cas4 [Chloroflexota bacterium]